MLHCVRNTDEGRHKFGVGGFRARQSGGAGPGDRVHLDTAVKIGVNNVAECVM